MREKGEARKRGCYGCVSVPEQFGHGCNYTLHLDILCVFPSLCGSLQDVCVCVCVCLHLRSVPECSFVLD